VVGNQVRPQPVPASASTDSATGSIMMLVAELLTHMLKKAVDNMKPPTRRAGARSSP
jgi:hypothetical protein